MVIIISKEKDANIKEIKIPEVGEIWSHTPLELVDITSDIYMRINNKQGYDALIISGEDASQWLKNNFVSVNLVTGKIVSTPTNWCSQVYIYKDAFLNIKKEDKKQ